MTSFWASINQNASVLCLNLKSLIKTPIFLGLHPKTLQKHFQRWIEEEIRRRRLKEVFFFIFPIFVVKKILKKAEKHSQKILKNRGENFKKTLKKNRKISEN